MSETRFAETTSTAEQPAEPQLRVEDVDVIYHGKSGDVHAVKKANFELHAGESIGLIGESGSGKSTLARAILGIEPVAGGRVLFEGAPRRFAGLHGQARLNAARQIQIVFQDPSVSLDPRETLTESLTRALSMHFGLRGTERERRIVELADQVGLTERQRKALPRDLSGGQKQRYAIARALSVQPKVLILDEAVSAIDVSVQAQILNVLNDLRSELGVSYLFVSHDLSVVRYVTDRSVVMRTGTIVETGATEKLLRDPKHDYTKLLISAVPGQHWDPAVTAQRRRALEESERVRDSGAI